MSSLYCDCPCHTGKAIFCSCFKPCCHQPYAPQAEQTALVQKGPIVIKFERVVLPEIKSRPRFEDVKELFKKER
jgi:hypothetical protein